jgi:hypothetical protein
LVGGGVRHHLSGVGTSSEEEENEEEEDAEDTGIGYMRGYTNGKRSLDGFEGCLRQGCTAGTRSEIREDGEVIRRRGHARGRAMLGMGALELAAAAAVSDAGQRARAGNAAAWAEAHRAEAAADAVEASMRAAEVTHRERTGNQDEAFPRDRNDQTLDVALSGLRPPLWRALGARLALERGAQRGHVLDAFAECLRDLHRITRQNNGASFDDVVTEAHRAERCFARHLHPAAAAPGSTHPYILLLHPGTPTPHARYTLHLIPYTMRLALCTMNLAPQTLPSNKPYVSTPHSTLYTVHHRA